jgi:hypothetical protein
VIEVCKEFRGISPLNLLHFFDRLLLVASPFRVEAFWVSTPNSLWINFLQFINFGDTPSRLLMAPATTKSRRQENTILSRVTTHEIEEKLNLKIRRHRFFISVILSFLPVCDPSVTS